MSRTRPLHFVLERCDLPIQQSAVIDLIVRPFTARESTDADDGLTKPNDYEKGFADGLEQGKVESKEEVGALQSNHEKAVQEIVAKYADDLVENVRVQLTSATVEVYQRLSALIAEMMAPLLETEVRKSAADAVIAELLEIAACTSHLSLKIFGPPEMLALVNSQLGSLPSAQRDQFPQSIDLVVHEKPDVRVELSETLIETRIGLWFEKMREVIET